MFCFVVLDVSDNKENAVFIIFQLRLGSSIQIADNLDII